MSESATWFPRSDIISAIAKARASLIPPARREGAVLVEVGRAGMLAPHVAGKGYHHVLVTPDDSGTPIAMDGVRVVRGDATALPLPGGCADVVSIGELFEHVADLPAAVGEACRLVRPGGVLIADIVNATRRARLVAVLLGEQLRWRGASGQLRPGAQFVPPARLVAECADHGVSLRVRGIRPAAGALLRRLVRRRGEVPIVSSRSATIFYQAWGIRSE